MPWLPLPPPAFILPTSRMGGSLGPPQATGRLLLLLATGRHKPPPKGSGHQQRRPHQLFYAKSPTSSPCLLHARGQLPLLPAAPQLGRPSQAAAMNIVQCATNAAPSCPQAAQGLLQHNGCCRLPAAFRCTGCPGPFSSTHLTLTTNREV